MPTVISVEHLSKSYGLGQIGTPSSRSIFVARDERPAKACAVPQGCYARRTAGTFTHDLNVWWARLRGKPNPMLRIGETDCGNREGENIWALKDVSFTVQQGEVLGIPSITLPR
jgi:lipopolysaccharide transport system ATP-binding protein